MHTTSLFEIVSLAKMGNLFSTGSASLGAGSGDAKRKLNDAPQITGTNGGGESRGERNLQSITLHIEEGFTRRDDMRIEEVFGRYANAECNKISPEQLNMALREVGVTGNIDAPDGLDLTEFIHAIRRYPAECWLYIKNRVYGSLADGLIPL